jgi:hypothetical protein
MHPFTMAASVLIVVFDLAPGEGSELSAAKGKVQKGADLTIHLTKWAFLAAVRTK